MTYRFKGTARRAYCYFRAGDTVTGVWRAETAHTLAEYLNWCKDQKIDTSWVEIEKWEVVA